MNLQPFCSTEPRKGNIGQPFNLSGYTWATDGRILVRVRLRKVAPMPKRVTPPQNTSEVFAASYPPDSYKGWVKLPPGKVPVIETKPCEMCGGTGKEDAVTQTGRKIEVECDQCDNGKIKLCTNSAIGKRAVDNRYLHLIMANLDGPVEVAASYGGDTMPLAFRAGEACGLLMPLRPERIKGHKIVRVM